MKLFEFIGEVIEIRAETRIKDCTCAEITVRSSHCQIMNDYGGSTSRFLTADSKFTMQRKFVEPLRLGQKLTITISAQD